MVNGGGQSSLARRDAWRLSENEVAHPSFEITINNRDRSEKWIIPNQMDVSRSKELAETFEEEPSVHRLFSETSTEDYEYHHWQERGPVPTEIVVRVIDWVSLKQSINAQ